MAQFLHKRESGDNGKGSNGQVGAPTGPESAAAVLEFLSLDRWENGQKRVPGSLTLFVEQGSLKVCVSDKDVRRIAFVSAGSWEGLWHELEGGLREGSLEWRAQRDRSR